MREQGEAPRAEHRAASNTYSTYLGKYGRAVEQMGRLKLETSASAEEGAEDELGLLVIREVEPTPHNLRRPPNLQPVRLPHPTPHHITSHHTTQAAAAVMNRAHLAPLKSGAKASKRTVVSSETVAADALDSTPTGDSTYGVACAL